MPTIYFEAATGEERTAIEVATGTSAMSAAIANAISGIEADCGGTCTCATCHVYVDQAFVHRLPPPGADEEAMLEFVAAQRCPNSRLSCQLRIDPSMDGLVLKLPDKQVL